MISTVCVTFQFRMVAPRKLEVKSPSKFWGIQICGVKLNEIQFVPGKSLRIAKIFEFSGLRALKVSYVRIVQSVTWPWFDILIRVNKFECTKLCDMFVKRTHKQIFRIYFRVPHNETACRARVWLNVSNKICVGAAHLALRQITKYLRRKKFVLMFNKHNKVGALGLIWLPRPRSNAISFTWCNSVCVVRDSSNEFSKMWHYNGSNNKILTITSFIHKIY